MWLNQKGRKQPATSGDLNPAKRPEIRAKLSQKMRGNRNAAGRPTSEETKRKISEALKGRINKGHLRRMAKKAQRDKETSLCLCGCGTQIKKYSGTGITRPNKYAVGHSMRGRKRPDISKLLQEMHRNGKIRYLRGSDNPRWKGGSHSEEARRANNTRNRKYSRSPKGLAAQKRKWANRRASRKIVSALTAKEWEELLVAFCSRCVYCWVPFGGKIKPTQDHVIPISRGGFHIKSNVVPACHRCNTKKQHRFWSILLYSPKLLPAWCP